MADPITVNCGSACTVTVVHEISLPVFNLSPQEGAVIASAILAVWGLAWCFRAVIQALKNIDGNQTLNED